MIIKYDIILYKVIRLGNKNGLLPFYYVYPILS